MAKKELWYISRENKTCGLKFETYSYMEKYVDGLYEFNDEDVSFRKATKEDVAWVRGMGGYVPSEYKGKL